MIRVSYSIHEGHIHIRSASNQILHGAIKPLSDHSFLHPLATLARSIVDCISSTMSLSIWGLCPSLHPIYFYIFIHFHGSHPDKSAMDLTSGIRGVIWALFFRCVVGLAGTPFYWVVQGRKCGDEYQTLLVEHCDALYPL